MNPWIFRLIIILLAIAFVPMIVAGTASLVTQGITSVGHSISSLLSPLSMSGSARIEGIIRLCLYLVSILILVRFLFGGPRGN
jgi:hypothetical protein